MARTEADCGGDILCQLGRVLTQVLKGIYQHFGEELNEKIDTTLIYCISVVHLPKSR